tara:strand:- start:6 stop:362 length:357 start_codon:yes stop_codon:yes gene_type:complete
MKILLVSLLSWCMINGCSPYVELKGRSKSGLVWMEPLDKVEKQLSKLPAHLVLVDKYFEEPDGDQALDAEEVGYLVVTLRNDGLGPAKISALLRLWCTNRLPEGYLVVPGSQQFTSTL